MSWLSRLWPGGGVGRGHLEAIAAALRVPLPPRGSVLEFSLDGMLVRLQPGGRDMLAVEVGGITPTLNLRCLRTEEGPAGGPCAVVGTGDLYFDRHYEVSGALIEAAPLLTFGARRGLVDLANQGFVGTIEIASGSLRTTLAIRDMAPRRVASSVRELGRVASLLRLPLDLDQRLLEVFEEEPSQALRDLAVIALLSRPASAQRGAVLERAARSADAFWRLAAAIASGDTDELAAICALDLEGSCPELNQPARAPLLLGLAGLNLESLPRARRRSLGLLLLERSGISELLVVGARVLAEAAEPGDAEAIDALWRWAHNSPSLVRWEVARALCKICGPGDLKPLRSIVLEARARGDLEAFLRLVSALNDALERLAIDAEGGIRIVPEERDEGAIKVEEDRERGRGTVRVAREGQGGA